MPALARRMLDRIPSGVAPELITAFNSFGLKYALRRRSSADATKVFLDANQRFCQLVCKSAWKDIPAVFTFNAAGLEILERAQREGRYRVMEQTIAPSRIERQLLAEEARRFPHWQKIPEDDAAEAYMLREEAEWKVADRILCGSTFVAEGVRSCGGPTARCEVVPYGIDLCRPISTRRSKNHTRAPGPLRVLTVGAVGLRKGAPYVLEAARLMKAEAQFRMVGAIEVQPEAERELREALELAGPVPRAELEKHFRWADVFLLPSLCEGSATVTYEALAAGLPVVCTSNTGSVVRDELDGYIVPVRDVDSIVRVLCHVRNDDVRQRMSLSATLRASEFTLESYRHRLIKALSK
jgi:glycosyltransferase involved in cell wall biosynthesis